MAVVQIAGDGLTARISTKGGIVLGLFWERDGASIPLLRAAPDDEADALASGCYPLVPFGNRVKGNHFSLDGRDYSLAPNTKWDPHYLHGEGWQAEWSILSQSERRLELGFSFTGQGTPYTYEARQLFTIADGQVTFGLSVRNKGDQPLPFGLGWHPYFPMTPATTLKAPARRFWTEVEGWLPGEATDIPADLDFRTPRGLPHRWINNGFEDWCGTAEVRWPERNTRLHLTADPLFRHAFIFVSDTAFDPAYRRDYFCFEPMSHLANGHNLAGLGDLTVLAKEQTLAGSIRFRPEPLDAPAPYNS
ncbi:aldose 1-epimerase [Rhizobium tumorigenes]|uniref:aldose 1-epimerase n=1 Tax=Rhizobium tumorigenes TaxID=2041385 RepID=UPI00241DE45B|nr:aldose 1-epimerase [Rhizobium tumorigenes]WFS04045.1 aldose 1-epimerase [Rhizobium tumorigenes]